MRKLGVFGLSLLMLVPFIMMCAQLPKRGQVFSSGPMIKAEGPEGAELEVGIVTSLRGQEAWERVKEELKNPIPARGMEYLMVKVKGQYQRGPYMFFLPGEAQAETADGRTWKQGAAPGTRGQARWVPLNREQPELEAWLVFVVPEGTSPLLLRVPFSTVGLSQQFEVWFAVP